MSYGAPCCLETTRTPVHAAVRSRLIRGRTKIVARFGLDPSRYQGQSTLWNGSLVISRPEHALEWIPHSTKAVARFGVDPSRYRTIARFGFDITFPLSPINYHSRHPKYQPPLVSHRQQSQRKPRRRSNRRSSRCSHTARSRRDGRVSRRAFEHANPQKTIHPDSNPTSEKYEKKLRMS